MALTELNLAESGTKCTEPHDIDLGEGGGQGSADLQSIIPIPREATSVATMMGLFPVLNSFKTQSRSFCCLSPWIAMSEVSSEPKERIRKLTQGWPTILAQKPSDFVCYAFGSSK